MKNLALGLILLLSLPSFADTIIEKSVHAGWTEGSSEYRLELVGGVCLESGSVNNGWFESSSHWRNQVHISECEELQFIQLVKSTLGSCRPKSESAGSRSNGFTQGGATFTIKFTKNCECLMVRHVSNGWTEGGATSKVAIGYENCVNLIPESSFKKILELYE